jgi:hypothetical protein
MKRINILVHCAPDGKEKQVSPDPPCLWVLREAQEEARLHPRIEQKLISLAQPTPNLSQLLSTPNSSQLLQLIELRARQQATFAPTMTSPSTLSPLDNFRYRSLQQEPLLETVSICHLLLEQLRQQQQQQHEAMKRSYQELHQRQHHSASHLLSVGSSGNARTNTTPAAVMTCAIFPSVSESSHTSSSRASEAIDSAPGVTRKRSGSRSDDESVKKPKVEERAAPRIPSKQKSRWLESFEALKRYKEAHGDCIVPRGYTRSPKLASWVAEQR